MLRRHQLGWRDVPLTLPGVDATRTPAALPRGAGWAGEEATSGRLPVLT